MNLCIIGNNLSSLTLSNALLNKNIKVTIFYSEKKKLFYPNRTIGITQENIEFFNKEILKVNSKYLKSIKQIEIFTEKNFDIIDKNIKIKLILNELLTFDI